MEPKLERLEQTVTEHSAPRPRAKATEILEVPAAVPGPPQLDQGVELVEERLSPSETRIFDRGD